MSYNPSKVFPDTPKGARACAVSQLNISKKEAERASVQPDPAVRGVWLLSWDLDEMPAAGMAEVLVYMAGYPDPWGQVREFNDAECGWQE